MALHTLRAHPEIRLSVPGFEWALIFRLIVKLEKRKRQIFLTKLSRYRIVFKIVSN